MNNDIKYPEEVRKDATERLMRANVCKLSKELHQMHMERLYLSGIVSPGWMIRTDIERHIKEPSEILLEY